MAVYIVGTSHIAGESVRKVRETILEKKPDCVAVELDVNRYVALKTRQKGDIKLPLLQKAIFSLMRYLQERLSRETNILPGEEMLAACEAGASVGARVAFIDRDIGVTLRRLMKRLGFFGQLKLFAYIVIGVLGIPVAGLAVPKELDLNRVPEDEFIENAMRELRRHFPAMYDVLVDERNRYMAHNIRKLEGRFGTVVAVMGAGHVKGVSKILEDKN